MSASDPQRPLNYYADIDWAQYAATRPRYPPELFEMLSTYLDKHNPAYRGERKAIDYGSGGGTIVRDLYERCGVNHVLATDLNAEALEEGKRAFEPMYGKERFKTLPGRAGYLDREAVPNASVDLAVAAEAAHWFEPDKWVAEAQRILRPGGTLCAWFYPFWCQILDCPAAVYPLWLLWNHIVRRNEVKMPGGVPLDVCSACLSLLTSVPLPDDAWRDHLHVKHLLPADSVQAHYHGVAPEALALNVDPAVISAGLRYEVTGSVRFKTATESSEVFLREKEWTIEKLLGYIASLHFTPMEELLADSVAQDALRRVEKAVGGRDATFDVGWNFGAFFVTKK